MMQYEKAVAAEPDAPLPRLHLADALYRLGQYRQSLAAAEEFIARHPHVGFAHVIAADSAEHLGRTDLVRTHRLLAQQLDPEFPVAFLGLAAIDPRFAELPEGWRSPQEIWAR